MIILTNKEFRKLNNKCFVYKIDAKLATDMVDYYLNLLELNENYSLIFGLELELNLKHQL